jgi:hypothetical protein
VFVGGGVAIGARSTVNVILRAMVFVGGRRKWWPVCPRVFGEKIIWESVWLFGGPLLHTHGVMVLAMLAGEKLFAVWRRVWEG